MLLLSIHPRYVDLILSGEKTVELRRRQPRIKTGQGLIYATAPRMQLSATFQISRVQVGPLELLWQLVRDRAGVSRAKFDSYFQGLTVGVGIEIGRVQEFGPYSLAELRSAWDGFHPPQGFRYVDSSDVARLKARRRKSA